MQRNIKTDFDAYLHLFSFLSEDCQLKFRSVNRLARDAARAQQAAPYQTKPSYAMALTGHFHENNRDYLYYSWSDYNFITMGAREPAYLYKLNPINDPLPFHMMGDGHVYSVKNHCWAYNQIWLLANMHAGNEFIVFSAVSDEHLLVPNSNNHSAFAKEIACVMKVGYAPTKLNDGTLILMPPHQAQLVKLKIADVKVTNDEIKNSFRLLQLFNNRRQQAAKNTKAGSKLLIK